MTRLPSSYIQSIGFFNSLTHVYICSEPKKGGKAVATTPGYSLMVLFNNRGAASPTLPQSVGGNCFPESALKPRCMHTY